MYGVQSLVGFPRTAGIACPDGSSSFGVLEIWNFLRSHFQHLKVRSWIISSVHSLTGLPVPDDQLFAIPFAKSAATGQHAPVRSYLGIRRPAVYFFPTG